MPPSAVFVTAAALLMVVTFALVLRPLWRRRPAATAVLIASLCVGSVGLYQLLGTPAAIDARALRQPDTLEEAIVLLEKRMAAQPDREGLALLANAYTRSGRAKDARDTWEKAIALAPDDPNLLVAAAEGRAMTDPGSRLDGRGQGWLEQALRIDPNHLRARFILGMALRQQGKPAEAVAMWEPLLRQMDQEQSATLRKLIADARSDAGLPSGETAAGSHALTVRVSLEPGARVANNLDSDAAVFVIARAPDGPPMPVAVKRLRLSQLPIEITLDDSDGPMPTARLSALKDVEVLARISRSGVANRQDGDIETPPVRVSLPTKAPLELRLGGG